MTSYWLFLRTEDDVPVVSMHLTAERAYAAVETYMRDTSCLEWTDVDERDAFLEILQERGVERALYEWNCYSPTDDYLYVIEIRPDGVAIEVTR